MVPPEVCSKCASQAEVNESKGDGSRTKAVLLLDNYLAHPNEEKLISADGKVIAKFLPSNVPSLIQLMEQVLLESIKRWYWKRFLKIMFYEDGTAHKSSTS